ncbi:MAG: hypothetical protein M1818_006207 [Claussenomyces sp. TS43310]|nr:MAG: hypothetical protein M1818_006207 [Claussenomyces sp. TS43310]
MHFIKVTIAVLAALTSAALALPVEGNSIAAREVAVEKRSKCKYDRYDVALEEENKDTVDAPSGGCD